ncbi:hypothetical protein GVanDAA622_14190 [Enterococcus faecium]|nr:hypothetical protein GVanDAA622_14190 [Enterococcus faecium]
MTYTHLTPNELVMIEAYFHQETPVAIVAKQLNVDAKQFTMSITFSNVVEQHLNTLNNTKKISDVVGEPKSFFLLRKKNTLQKDQLKVGPQTSLLAVQSEPSLVQ